MPAAGTLSLIRTLVAAFVLLGAAGAQAAVDRICIVSVKVSNGWSTEQPRRVTFVTGLELSRITRVLRFDFHQQYALIWHGSGLPTVVRVDALVLGIGQEFGSADFLRVFEHAGEQLATQVEGEGQNLKWRIRARTSSGWVDPDMALIYSRFP